MNRKQQPVIIYDAEGVPFCANRAARRRALAHGITLPQTMVYVPLRKEIVGYENGNRKYRLKPIYKYYVGPDEFIPEFKPTKVTNKY